MRCARSSRAPVLALFTFRSEFEPPWVGLPNVGILTLGRLDRNDVENMVVQVTGGRVRQSAILSCGFWRKLFGMCGVSAMTFTL